MHITTIKKWKHDHSFNKDNKKGERRTLFVIILTAVMMVFEIGAGGLFGSVALLADGWHMGTHVAALAITLFAYRYAESNKNNPKFSFGTGKVGALGGFASAISLAVVAMVMAFESIERLISPTEIRFNEAILVAVIGLVVNLLSAYLLHAKGGGHNHDHHHNGNDHDHEDHNLKAAYLHVLADALTSFTAIFALLAGKSLGWVWMDPIMGIVGAIVITRWAYSLLTATSNVLLDSANNEKLIRKVTEIIEQNTTDRIIDLHLWNIATGQYSLICSLVSHDPQPPAFYHEKLIEFDNICHMTFEVIPCEDEECGG